MEQAFVFEKAGYPCYQLDEELNIVHTNGAVRRPCAPGMLRAMLSEADVSALRGGQPVQLPWEHLPDQVYTLNILPVEGGYAAAVLPVTSRPDNYRRMLEKTAGALNGMLVTLPALHHFMEDDSQGVQMLEYSIREGYRALRAVCDQHWCARLASGIVLEKQAVDLNELLENLCDAVGTMLPEVSIDYRGEDAPVCVSADRALLEQIICHILSNAVQYGSEDQSVTVRLQRLKNRAVVHVSDAGKGIRAQAAPHVFDAYYSIDPYGDTEERPGDGMGLYLVRQGLQAMGGECAMESEFGCGTQISFALPFAEDAQPVVRTRLREYLMDRFSCVYMHFCPLGASLWP